VPSRGANRAWPVLAIVAVLAAGLLPGCGGSSGGSPQKTIRTFLDATAAGDGAKACAQLTEEAKRQITRGASCERAIKLVGALLASATKSAKVTNVKSQGDTASATVAAAGGTRATYRLRKSDGKWLIAKVERMNAPGTAAAAGPAPGGPSAEPPRTRIRALVDCLSPTFGTISNYGADSIGGVRHVVLGITIRGAVNAAEVEVYSSPVYASAGYPGLQQSPLFRAKKLKLKGSSIVVYRKPVAAGEQRKIEACA